MSTIQINTSDLVGAALDWAVAKCEGMKPSVTHVFSETWPDGLELEFYRPSTNWAVAGPILEREEIELHVLPYGLTLENYPTYKDGDNWEANIWPPEESVIKICGPTPLIASMRCYVASKLGDSVSVPAELV